jgi:hypothetical protein
MLNRIQRTHLPIKAEKPQTLAQPEPRQSAPKAVSQAVQVAANQSQPDPLGVELMRSAHGNSFTHHYYSAWSASGRVDGKNFLDHYRALKNCARQQGMSAEEFRGFERCLYQRFYRAACRDSMQRTRDGRELRVQPKELAYLAKVAGISAGQLERDAIAMRRSQCSGEMKAIVARHGGAFARLKSLA